MRIIRTTALVCLAAATLAGASAMAAPGDIMFTAKLTGAAETPPAALNSTGLFQARLNPASGQLCYTLTSQNLDMLTMAHIHAGAVGVAGPPVVVLLASAPSETCMSVDKDVAAKLIANPADYYVNVHTSQFPKGAIRGQLAK